MSEENSSCELCGLSFSSEETLREHLWSMIHHIKVENKKKNAVHTCTLCFQVCKSLSEYSKHLNGPSHRKVYEERKKKEAEEKKPAPGNQDRNATSQNGRSNGTDRTPSGGAFWYPPPFLGPGHKRSRTSSLDRSRGAGSFGSSWTDASSRWNSSNPFHHSPKVDFTRDSVDPPAYSSYMDFTNTPNRGRTPRSNAWRNSFRGAYHGTPRGPSPYMGGSRKMWDSSFNNAPYVFNTPNPSHNELFFEDRTGSRKSPVLDVEKRDKKRPTRWDASWSDSTPLVDARTDSFRQERVHHKEPVIDKQSTRSLMQTDGVSSAVSGTNSGDGSVKSNVVGSVRRSSDTVRGVDEAAASGKQDILDRAENMCRELREKREQARVQKERKEKVLQQENEMQQKISLGLREIRESVESSKHPPVSRDKDMTSVETVGSLGASTSAVDSLKITISQSVAKPRSVSRDNLSQLVNVPTHRQKMNIAQILRSHHQKTARRTPAPCAGTENVTDIQSLAVDDLPDDLKLQIAALLDSEANDITDLMHSPDTDPVMILDNCDQKQSDPPTGQTTHAHNPRVSEESEISTTNTGSNVPACPPLMSSTTVLKQSNTNTPDGSVPPSPGLGLSELFKSTAADSLREDLSQENNREEGEGEMRSIDTMGSADKPSKMVLQKHYSQFTKFCNSQKLTTDKLTATELDTSLEQFYAFLHKKGKLFKKSLSSGSFSFMRLCLRFSLHRRRRWDIFSMPEFYLSNRRFLEIVKLLPKKARLVKKLKFNPVETVNKLVFLPQFGIHTPDALQSKVAMDIMLYLKCRKGNLGKLHRHQFTIEIDNNGQQCICATHPLSAKRFKAWKGFDRFRHKIVSIPGSELCPVRTFLKYCEKLEGGSVFFRKCEVSGSVSSVSSGAMWYTGPPIRKPGFLVQSLMCSANPKLTLANWLSCFDKIPVAAYMKALKLLERSKSPSPVFLSADSPVHPKVIIKNMSALEIAQLSTNPPPRKEDDETDSNSILSARRTQETQVETPGDQIEETKTRPSANETLDNAIPFPCPLTHPKALTASAVDTDKTVSGAPVRGSGESEDVTNSWTMLPETHSKPRRVVKVGGDSGDKLKSNNKPVVPGSASMSMFRQEGLEHGKTHSDNKDLPKQLPDGEGVPALSNRVTEKPADSLILPSLAFQNLVHGESNKRMEFSFDVSDLEETGSQSVEDGVGNNAAAMQIDGGSCNVKLELSVQPSQREDTFSQGATEKGKESVSKKRTLSDAKDMPPSHSVVSKKRKRDSDKLTPLSSSVDVTSSSTAQDNNTELPKNTLQRPVAKPRKKREARKHKAPKDVAPTLEVSDPTTLTKQMRKSVHNSSPAITPEDAALVDKIVQETIGNLTSDPSALPDSHKPTSQGSVAGDLDTNQVSRYTPSPVVSVSPVTTLAMIPESLQMDTSTASNSSAGNSVMNQILQISLEEESVRAEKQQLGDQMSQLQLLLQKTQEELFKCQHKISELTNREDYLRKSRLLILQGAVTTSQLQRSLTPTSFMATGSRSNSPLPMQFTPDAALTCRMVRSSTPTSMHLEEISRVEAEQVHQLSTSIKTETCEAPKPAPRKTVSKQSKSQQHKDGPTSEPAFDLSIVKRECVSPTRTDEARSTADSSKAPSGGTTVQRTSTRRVSEAESSGADDDGLQMRYLGKVKPQEFAKYIAKSTSVYSVISEDEFLRALSDGENAQQVAEGSALTAEVGDEDAFKKPADPHPLIKPCSVVLSDDSTADSSFVTVTTLANDQEMDEFEPLETARSKDGRSSNISMTSARSAASTRRKVSEFYPDPDSPVRKRLRKKKQRDMTTSLNRVSESNSDSSVVEESSSSPSKGRKMKKKNGVYKKLTEWLAEESSDIEIEGLNEAPPKTLPSQGIVKQEPGNISPKVYKDNHKQSILSMKVYKDFLYACSQDGTASKYDIHTGSVVMQYRGHKKAVSCIVVTETRKSGVMVLTGGRDKQLTVFDDQTGAQITQLSIADEVTCMSEQWSRVWLGLNNGNILSFSPKQKQCMDGFKSSDQSICDLVCTTEGPRRILCISSMDSVISVRDANSGLLLRNLQATSHGPGRLFLVDDLLYSASRDMEKILHCNNIPTGELVNLIKHKGGVITDLHCTKTHLYICSLDGIVHCINLEDKSTVCVYGAGKEVLTAMVIKDNTIFTGNRRGVCGNVPLPVDKFECQFGSCSCMFGLASHLVHHVVAQHILANKSVIRCLWKDCKEWITTNGEKMNAKSHIEEHVNNM